MNDWIKQYFPIFFPLFFVASWTVSLYLVAAASGWRLLATRFRAQGSFTGQTWRMQFARMRWMSNYNGALTIGADTTGLFMVPMMVFRLWHPPLFIPWTEITLVGTRQVLFFTLVEFRLGTLERVPFNIKPELAARLRSAAGASWLGDAEPAVPAPPPPIS